MALKTKFANLLIPAAAAVTIPFLPVQDAQAFSSPQIFATQPAQPANNQTSDTLFLLLKAALVAGGSSGVIIILAAFMFRRVVSTNMVHIVQSGKSTMEYGANLPNGNVYYEVPTWVPKLGVSVIKLPVNNFDLSLKDYEAYDEDRVPFLVDLTAFFRIDSPSTAAKRNSSFDELKKQLELIIQGAVRKVLASYKIDNIMTQRSTFGESFSEEVKEQLAEWGVSPVRNMEIKDIRDVVGSKVIANIMAKKISQIERDSRIEVAENQRLATVAEVENKRMAEVSQVEAEREVNLSRQAAEQEIGERTAAKEKAVGVATEQSRQQVLLQQAATKEKDLAVVRVEELQTAEIERDRAIVEAQKAQKVATIAKETALIEASQNKETTVLIAEGNLGAEKKKAEAIQAKGIAQAEAEKALQLAPVSAQIALAQEIGSNESYQKFLALVEAVKAYIAVGTEQAKSLQNAEIKVIASGGSAPEGVSKIGDIFGPKGGTGLAAALEALAQSDIGAGILSRLATEPKDTDI